jgi:hypothetical protein
MKKLFNPKILLILVAMVVTCNIKAQDKDKDKPAKIGIRAGWNYASMFIDGDQLSGTDRMNSFYVGLFKEKKLVPFLRFGSGLEYLQNGYKIDDNVSRDLRYISVPLYLKVKIGPVYATGGTGLNFKVGESLPGNALRDPLNNKETNFFDMPLQLSAGLKILMFSVEARYNWGMLNVNNNASNQYLQLGFTVSF